MYISKNIYEIIPYFCIFLGLIAGIYDFGDPTSKLHLLEHIASIILVIIGVIILKLRTCSRCKKEGIRMGSNGKKN